MPGLRLITLDLLGTVYRFSRPVYATYAEIASQCLNQKVEEARVKQGFKKAIAKAQPHHGAFDKEGSMGWWTKLVQDTFKGTNTYSFMYPQPSTLYNITCLLQKCCSSYS